MADKVKYGVKNVHYALVTSSGYGTPASMPGAVSLSLSPNGDRNDFYADDIRYFVTVANNGYDCELEVAYVPEAFLENVLGVQKDGTAKAYYETAAQQPKPFALMFEEEGDETGTKYVLYNCIAQRPSRNLATTTDTIEPQTQTITIAALPKPTGETLAFTGPETTTTVLSGWYTSVWQHS